MIKTAIFLTLLIIDSIIPAAAKYGPPEIGTATRIQISSLGPGWHYGFFNRLRVEPPCYLVIIFEERTSKDDPLRIKAAISIEEVERLEITAAPGTSMEEWDGSNPVNTPGSSWQEVQLDSLLPEHGFCNYDISNN